jgi:hypothetical protein
MKKYACITGRSGCGKETAYQYLRVRLGECGLTTSVHHFSDMLNEDLEKYDIPNTRPNQQRLSTFWRTAPWEDKTDKLLPPEWGQGLMSRQMQKRALADTADRVFLDGLRRPSDLEMVKVFPNYTLVGIIRDPHKRWLGLRERNDRPGDAEKTWEDFEREQQAEPEQLIDQLVAQAHFIIKNDGSLEDLGRELDNKVLERLS